MDKKNMSDGDSSNGNKPPSYHMIYLFEGEKNWKIQYYL